MVTSLKDKRKYQHSAKGKATAAAYRRSQRGKAIVLRQRAKHLQKVNARKAVDLALRKGILMRPKACACGNSPVQAHHHKGYDEMNWLTVEWLCGPCHRRSH